MGSPPMPGFHTIAIQYTLMSRDIPITKTTLFTVPKRYVNLQFLSAGAQGTVVSAHDEATNRNVAIKKMEQPFNGAEYAKRAYREFVLLSSVRHPNIIPMFSAFTPQEDLRDFRELYLVMELMSYSLHQVIEQLKANKCLPLDHKTLSFFMYQSLCAINHLRKSGIIHRDLKPANMVVNTDGCVLKVLDFGLARKAPDADTRMSGYVVTRYYRAPEVILGYTDTLQYRTQASKNSTMLYTGKVDIWSLGCIFAEIINRDILFSGQNAFDQWNAITSKMGSPSAEFTRRLPRTAALFVEHALFQAPKPIEEVIPDGNFRHETEQEKEGLTASNARDLLKKMLAIDPDERFSVQEALYHPYVRLWMRDDEVNAPGSVSRYNQRLDTQEFSLQEWKTVLFDEVKRFERSHDVFGDIVFID